MTSTASMMTSNGADFALITPRMFALAAKLGIEIVGCAKGFNGWKDGDTISDDCTPEELWQWLQGFECGKDDIAGSVKFTATALEVPAEEITAAIATANGAVWKLDVSGEQITITGRKFKETVTGWPAFLAFVKGYESSCYAHDFMFASVKHVEAGVPMAGSNGGAV